jgi:hypothetical protein
MAKLPSSFRSRNRTSENFRRQYAALPVAVKEAIREACLLFDRNPAHPSLRHHELRDVKKGKHAPSSYSVSPTMQHRAIYVSLDGVNVWYWVGTHADYKIYTASPR